MAQSKTTLIQQFKKLAKRANQRLVRLERAAETRPELLDWSYRIAQHDIKSWRGEGKTRYPTSVSSDKPINQIQARIADLEKFLDMPTSTVSGIKRVENKRIDTINKNEGTDFNLGDFEKFARSGLLDKAKAEFGSKTMFEAIAQIQKQKDKVIQQMRQHRKREITVDNDDPIVQDIVDQMLSSRKYGKKLIDILK